MVATHESVTASFAEKRVSWGAIIAGAVVALTVQALLAVLGIAIGASVIDPVSEANPVDGIAIGAGIYFLISSLLSLLAGGYVAGALSRVQERRNRTLHGLTTWAVVTLLSVMLLATGLGRLVGGTMNIVGKGLSQAGDVASAVAGPIANEVGQRMQDAEVEADVNVESLRQEARQLLRDTGAPGLQPGQVEQTAEQLRAQAGDAAARIARDPQRADEVMEQVFDRMSRTVSSTIEAADRDALVNVLAERTEMTREEAQQTVSNWERTYAQASAQASQGWEQMKVQAEQRARELGQQTAEAVAAAAWWSFFILLLTAIAAAIGANLGADRAVVAVRTSR